MLEDYLEEARVALANHAERHSNIPLEEHAHAVWLAAGWVVAGALEEQTSALERIATALERGGLG